MAAARSYVALTLEVLIETDLAVLVYDPINKEPDGGPCEVWIPKSVIENSDDIADPGDVCDLGVARWFAKREGLIE